ncbi:serine/arginine repetitive matrix protein 5-like [Frieseomelitta varia]|uniref:serine/arginine repetitive matrix protein 5-like n=1 Tax=Frieseomelitta varia TaxID=561572 RepID=UPI001CB679AC|nr:serine/arginine repetitive matrix protein 5-like [Frieseomelitta varia]
MQKCLVSDPLQMHTTACPARFWTFFDLSAKGGSRSNEKERSESKDIVPSSFPNSDLDDVSKSPTFSNAAETFSPYGNECQFDLRSTPMNCLRVHRPLKEESLASLLDGQPVPMMLKWKLKGYKTLRNENAIDFAFVPGGKSHEDFDILPRNERRTKVTDNLGDTAERLHESLTVCKKTVDDDEKVTLRLTTKAIENKVETEAEDTEKNKIVENDNDSKRDESRNVPNQNLLLSASVRKESVKYLPISKSELKYQTQPAARFSSRPPKKVWKPSAPILKRTDCERLDKEAASMEFDEEKRAASKPSIPRFTELTENSTEWSSVGSQRNQEYPIEREMKTKVFNSFESSAEASSQNEPNEFERSRSRDVSSTESPGEDLDRVETDEIPFEPRSSSMYFAPRASKRRSLTTEGVTLEPIIGTERTTPRLNITRPDESRVNSSPCAATLARLRQIKWNRSASSSRMDTFGNGKSQSMPGNSDGGSRKPPASFPPVTAKRSSSYASCLLGKTPASKAAGSSPNSKNSSLNISTCSANPARKCRDENDECSGPRRKKREQERPCNRDKETCKRYCCPALQTPTKCDYDRFQCPKDTCGQSVQPRQVTRDRTFSPNDECKDQGREFCTTPRKREDCSRSCSRERSRPCSERRRSCQREYSEQEDRSQERVRKICTKPRKLDSSCKRQRKSNDRECSRSTKCNGRRNYTQSAISSRCKVTRNVKHYSSAPLFVSHLIARENLFVSPPIYHPPIRSKSDDKSSRPSSKCKLTVDKCKKEEPCRKKKDPCMETRGTCKKKEDPCKRKKRPSCKKEDPCKKTRPTCKKEETCGPEVKRVDDPCKKTRSMTKMDDDSCKKSSKSKTDDRLKCSATTEDTCSTKRERMCQEKKMAFTAKDSSESVADKIERERKEVEDCKKHINSRKKVKETKEAVAPGLERVISPCKQQLKDKKTKFTSIKLPLKNFVNSVSDTCTRQAGNLLNLSSDRLYSAVRSSNSDEINRETNPPGSIRNFWSFNEGDVEEIPIPLIDNQDNGLEDGPNWFLPWFTNY